jgi:predicted esterase YcpF (UPF0227 family)
MKESMKDEFRRGFLVGVSVSGFFAIVLGMILIGSVTEIFMPDVPDAICKELYGENAYFYDNEIGTNKHLYCKNTTEIMINPKEDSLVMLIEVK